MSTEKFDSIITALPDGPGVYQFYDSDGKLIYVGKAKSLRKRVASYFNGCHYGKVAVLVGKIDALKHIIVNSEADALLLENSMIKEHQPRYNVMLKDDKTYPCICVKNENFPRVFVTRNVIKDGSVYFGPYSSGRTIKTLLDLVKQLYKLRTCNFHLSPENIANGKFKVCLEYHIGNCKAPCTGLQEKDEYDNSISAIKHILKGNISEVMKYLEQQMRQFSVELKFEQAQLVKEKIDLLQNFQAKSTVVSQAIENVDVFSIADHEKLAIVNYMKVTNGAIIQSHCLEIKKKLDEPKEELLLLAVIELRQRFGSNSKEIIVPFDINSSVPDAEIHVPQRGDKAKLLGLSERNAAHFLRDKLEQLAKINPNERRERVLATMKNDLRLLELPVHIECFDNSNMQGSNPVASCVVFKNAAPSKKEYRHFNIKTVEGIDDFASIEEIVYRRYRRLLDENKSLPQLIVIDGGKGQLSAAVNSLKRLEIYGKLAIIGIAKRLEEIYFPSDSVPIYLDKTSVTLKVIQNLRNEAHRFGISFHRTKRSNDFISSELDNIAGIGPNTIQKLFATFKSVENIRAAGMEQLAQVIGKSKSQILLNYFAGGK